MEFASIPEQAIGLLDRAFYEGDLDRIMSLYDEAAIVVPRPGTEARGHDAIRSLYGRMIQPGVGANQLRSRVVEADGIALFISQWILRQPGQETRTYIATTVLRRQSDGQWKAFIDNAQGPAILFVWLHIAVTHELTEKCISMLSYMHLVSEGLPLVLTSYPSRIYIVLRCRPVSQRIALLFYKEPWTC
jgi:ketosteroid isomerase-like protein